MLCQYQSRARLLSRPGRAIGRAETRRERNCCQSGGLNPDRSRTLAPQTQKGQLPVTLFAPSNPDIPRHNVPAASACIIAWRTAPRRVPNSGATGEITKMASPWKKGAIVPDRYRFPSSLQLSVFRGISA